MRQCPCRGEQSGTAIALGTMGRSIRDAGMHPHHAYGTRSRIPAEPPTRGGLYMCVRGHERSMHARADSLRPLTDQPPQRTKPCPNDALKDIPDISR